MMARGELSGIGRGLLIGRHLTVVVMAGLDRVMRTGMAVMLVRYGRRGLLRRQALLAGKTIGGESDRRQPDQRNA